MYYSVYYINILIKNDDFFDDLPKFSEHFLRISKSWSKTRQSFPNIFQKFPKITEDFRGGTDDVLIIKEHIFALFKRLCNHSNGDLFTSEKNMLFSSARISCLQMKACVVFQCCLYNETDY